ncbi:MAG: SDR family NAD(P)-dependent oxidoreductase [Pseudonocardia sp.]
MKTFTDRVAVITGAGSGIGRALALDLAGRGAHLALFEINEESLAETVTACQDQARSVRGYQVDVSDRKVVHDLADTVLADFGRVNLVVNNAGVGLMASVEEMTYEDLDWLVGINWWGVVHGTKAFLPHLIASGDGHLVNVSSAFGFVSAPTQSAYNATKFAVRGFTEALRQEMLIAGHKVGVSCVHPGGIRTNIAKTSRAADPSQVDRLATQFAKVTRTSPADAAKTILNGVRRNHARILIGADAYLIDAVPRLIGSAYQDLNVFGIRHSGYDVMVGGL